MSSNVYVKPVDNHATAETVQGTTRELLDTLTEKEGVALSPKGPLKVHVGEAKNVTFLKPENCLGGIGYLEERGIEPCYMETCVRYGGQRFKRELHEKTAEAHGFTQFPVVFADGDHGEAFEEVAMNQNHFETFREYRAGLRRLRPP